MCVFLLMFVRGIDFTTELFYFDPGDLSKWRFRKATGQLRPGARMGSLGWFLCFMGTPPQQKWGESDVRCSPQLRMSRLMLRKWVLGFGHIVATHSQSSWTTTCWVWTILLLAVNNKLDFGPIHSTGSEVAELQAPVVSWQQQANDWGIGRHSHSAEATQKATAVRRCCGAFSPLRAQNQCRQVPSLAASIVLHVQSEARKQSDSLGGSQPSP